LRYLLVLYATLLAGCAGLGLHGSSGEPPHRMFENDLFGQAPDIIAANDVYRLSDEQQRRFLAYFRDPLRANVAAHERVYGYLETATTGFDFSGDTYTATVALERVSGNCLSLAILTTALADLADVEIAYQLTDSVPVFESHGKVIYKGVHARSILYDPAWTPEENMLMIGRPGIRVDYFPSGTERFNSNLSKGQFIAMYYSNLAADAIAAGELSTAFWLLRKSMEFAPDSAAAVNMLAVVYRRAGDERKAEEIYRFGIEHMSDKVSLLRNYRILLTQQRRFDEVDVIGAKLARLEDPNPFDWVHAAQQAHDEGRYAEALTLYRKAVAIAPYLHEGYFGMARSYFELGDYLRAETELTRALERAGRESTRSLYQAKLMVLQSVSFD
jgi:Tfp pilus assembly protein PilF